MSRLTAFSAIVPRGLGVFARRNFRWELRSALLLPTAIACIEGNVLGVIAKKAFEAPDWAIGVITAAAPAANLLGFAWATLVHGKDRVLVANAMQVGVLICVLAIAAAPLTSAGLAVVIAAACVARVLLAGLVTARADLWRANYPDQRRAQVTGRLAMCVTVILSASALLTGIIMDRPELGGDEAFRAVFALSAVLGGFGVIAFSRVRWRGRGAQLADERRSKARGTGAGPRAMVGVLREDHRYRRYMAAQFILGFSNLAAVPVFILALQNVFNKNYAQSMLLAQAIPMLLPVLTIPIWARLFDGMHVIRFRAYHSWLFVASLALVAVGFLLRLEWPIYIAQIIRGAAMGGGMLAWNLGHHDFASRELANVYMGIHTTLTGVRGVLASLVGVAMYAGLSVAGAPLLPGMGEWVFVVLTLVAVAAAVLFVRLHIDLRNLGSAADADHGLKADR